MAILPACIFTAGRKYGVFLNQNLSGRDTASSLGSKFWSVRLDGYLRGGLHDVSTGAS